MYNIPQYNSFFDGRKSDLWNMLMVSEGRNQGYSQYQNQQYEESSYSSYFNGKNDFWYCSTISDALEKISLNGESSESVEVAFTAATIPGD